MKRKRIINTLVEAINKLCEILPVFFWIFLIFGFDEPHVAIMTILSALIHEAGHICYVVTRLDGRPDLRGALSGFRIRKSPFMSYKQEFLTYLSGPLANLFVFVVLSLLSAVIGGEFFPFAIINLTTAVSNLLPIVGYDGYGILVTLIKMRDMKPLYLTLLSSISDALIFSLCIISLYFIDRHDGGYWIFGLFFVSMIKCINTNIKRQKERYNEL